MGRSACEHVSCELLLLPGVALLVSRTRHSRTPTVRSLPSRAPACPECTAGRSSEAEDRPEAPYVTV